MPATPTRRRVGAFDILHLTTIVTLATVVGIIMNHLRTPDRELEALRQQTAVFHDFAKAQEAGYTFQVPRCRDNQPEGGMGWHYANPALLDDTVVVDRPEILIYEPQADSSLQLVGVEYVILYANRPRSATPPTLLGQTFLPNDNDQLWMLHVWLHRENPKGMFATWNPRVSCAPAAHH